MKRNDYIKDVGKNIIVQLNLERWDNRTYAELACWSIIVRRWWCTLSLMFLLDTQILMDSLINHLKDYVINKS